MSPFPQAAVKRSSKGGWPVSTLRAIAVQNWFVSCFVTGHGFSRAARRSSMSGFSRWSSFFWGISLAAVLLHSSAFAQRYDASKPCSEGQRRQFDFWLGSWDVTWPASSHGPAGSGRDAVQKILANCAVQENF